MACLLLKRFYHLGDKSSAANYQEGEAEEVLIMSIRLPKNATLGDLIVAVTDEVTRLTRGSVNANILVSYIVRDLLAKRVARPDSRRVLKVA